MDKKYIVIGIICLAVIITLVLITILVIKHNEKLNKIEDIESISYSYTTGYHMNANIDYELICSEKCSLYFKDDGENPEEKKNIK